MKIVSIGGGPAGLYFASLIKQAHPSCTVEVHERNRSDDTFGFGVVFSDATLGNLEEADPLTYEAITDEFAYWKDIDVHIKGEKIRSKGHGFCGLARQTLLAILQKRCEELGVVLHFESEVEDPAQFDDADLILAADGVASGIRTRYASDFEPDVDLRPNRFVWLGTTVPFDAFTFYFKENECGLWRVHAYRYSSEGSTFIVECTEDTWRAAGLEDSSEDETIAYLETLFRDELGEHRLIKNRSIWRSFPTVKNRRWHRGNVVLLGDAVHTAHFSIGSGTKLAMEDAIVLRDCLVDHEFEVEASLTAYEERRRPSVERLQRAAQVSLEWFEDTERYLGLDPLLFTFCLMTRSLRVGYENLTKRDPELATAVRERFAELHQAPAETEPMHVPVTIAGLRIPNRVVGKGGALRLLGSVSVSEEGRFSEEDAGLYNAGHEASLRSRVEECRELGMLRLHHAGPRGLGARPSASGVSWSSQSASGADQELLDELSLAYGAAAQRAMRAGVQWLELDFSNGGLVASFLSPLTNKRRDEHGSDRGLLAAEIVKRVRMAGNWPADRPLTVRFAASDWHPEGLTGPDAVELARRLGEAGANALTVTSGHVLESCQPPEARLEHARLSDMIRNEAQVATLVEVDALDDVNTLVASGRADLCFVA